MITAINNAPKLQSERVFTDESLISKTKRKAHVLLRVAAIAMLRTQASVV